MSISIARYLICAIGLNAGETGSYGKHFGSSELKCKELRRDVGTSRRWDVATLGQQIYKSTSGNVTTLQCRDVSAISASPSLKAKRGPEFKGGNIVRRRAWKSE